MYKVLLVDDEALVREAMSENVKWGELGYELCASCRNGKEAIETIKSTVPDLVLTDICMPYIDGIELSKFLYEQYPDVKIIIFSGYDEFEYAKQAMKYRVLEYLLKPVTVMELSQLLTKLKAILQEENNKKENIKRLQGAFLKNLPLLQTRYLNQLLQGMNKEYDEVQIQKKLNELQLNLVGELYQVGVATVEYKDCFLTDSNKNKDLPDFIVFNIMEEMIKEKEAGIIFQDLNGSTIIIFASNSKEQLRNLITEVYEQCQTLLAQYYHLGITMGLGFMIYSFTRISYSYNGAMSALEYKFLFGENCILDIKDFGIAEKENNINVTEKIHSLILAVKLNDKNEIVSRLEQVVAMLRDARLSKNRIYIYIQNIIVAIGNLLEDMGLGEESLVEEQDEIIRMLYQEETLTGVQNTVKKFCLTIGEHISEQRDSFGKKQALLAVEYIEKNYSNPNITLQSICTDLAISTSYFSSIFKSYTGETFIEALTKKRMHKAKELLEHTTMKNYEISEKVGYSDPHYFAITFKKYVRMTPKEYARKMKEGI